LAGPIVAGFAIALILALVTKWPLFRFIGNPIVLEFAMGVAIAHLPTYSRKVGSALILLSLAGFALSIPASERLLWAENMASLDTPWRFAQWGLPAAALVAGALQFEGSLKGRIAAALERGGDASYSIYLAHMLPALALRHILPWPLTFAVSIGTGLIVYRFVEMPVQQSLRTLGRKKERVAVEVPAVG
jgi:exopolysaccharide production protein ExoZ